MAGIDLDRLLESGGGMGVQETYKKLKQTAAVILESFVEREQWKAKANIQQNRENPITNLNPWRE